MDASVLIVLNSFLAALAGGLGFSALKARSRAVFFENIAKSESIRSHFAVIRNELLLDAIDEKIRYDSVEFERIYQICTLIMRNPNDLQTFSKILYLLEMKTRIERISENQEAEKKEIDFKDQAEFLIKKYIRVARGIDLLYENYPTGYYLLKHLVRLLENMSIIVKNSEAPMKNIKVVKNVEIMNANRESRKRLYVKVRNLYVERHTDHKSSGLLA